MCAHLVCLPCNSPFQIHRSLPFRSENIRDRWYLGIAQLVENENWFQRCGFRPHVGQKIAGVGLDGSWCSFQLCNSIIRGPILYIFSCCLGPGYSKDPKLAWVLRLSSEALLSSEVRWVELREGLLCGGTPLLERLPQRGLPALLCTRWMPFHCSGYIYPTLTKISAGFKLFWLHDYAAFRWVLRLRFIS